MSPAEPEPEPPPPPIDWTIIPTASWANVVIDPSLVAETSAPAPPAPARPPTEPSPAEKPPDPPPPPIDWTSRPWARAPRVLIDAPVSLTTVTSFALPPFAALPPMATRPPDTPADP